MAALNVIVMVVCALWFLVYLDRRTKRAARACLSSCLLRRVPCISAAITRRSLPGWTSVHLPLLALCSTAIR